MVVNEFTDTSFLDAYDARADREARERSRRQLDERLRGLVDALRR